MGDDLNTWVQARLDSADISDDAKLLILAALDGDEALADYGGYEPPQRHDQSDLDQTEPVGAFLKQIAVRGFRGIGEVSVLNLQPGPSLTVVSGRNGSGKSSFAEALEVALTRTTYRWLERTGQWREHWRNVHGGQPAEIEVTLVEEGIGPTLVRAAWSPMTEDFGDVDSSVQRKGEKRQQGLEALGWSGPLRTYRPLLTYEEVGSLLTSAPSELYDALSTVLGLEQLTEAVKRLAKESQVRGAPKKELDVKKKSLRDELAQMVGDERALNAERLLKKRQVDADQLRKLALGTVVVDGPASQLRAVVGLAGPSTEVAGQAAAELRAATEDLAAAVDSAGAALDRRRELMQIALEVHDESGDQTCPVCAAGMLDSERTAALRSELARTEAEVARVDRARSRQQNALRTARSMISPMPPELSGEKPDSVTEDVEQAKQAWQAWADAPEGMLQLADHLSAMALELEVALAGLRQKAESELEQLDQAWAAVAGRLAAHADGVDDWAEAEASVSVSAEAHQWLKEHEGVLKNERLSPIADQAKEIWSMLRQDSNVSIAGIELAGTNTKRHVNISAAIDGEDTGALAVMSQGELHALALALFLPRATLPGSPFRFVVLDDPVQAMDPTKVEGLVRVLLEIARTRQVIVFSHDDRFASAVRRAPKEVPVQVLDVVREAASKVTVQVTHSPAQRYLRDAYALTKDSGLPEATRRRVLPGLLRLALEAKAREVFFGRELGAGVEAFVVEQQWADTTTLRNRIALATVGESRMEKWLDGRPHRRPAQQAANAHSGLKAHQDPSTCCDQVQRTLADIDVGAQ